MSLPASSSVGQTSNNSYFQLPKMSPGLKKIAALAFGCFALYAMMTPVGAAGVGTLGLAVAPLLNKRGGTGCTNATTYPNSAVDLASTTLNEGISAFDVSLTQLSSGNFLEALAGLSEIDMLSLTPSLQVSTQFTVEYLSPGAGGGGVANPVVQILSSGANSTVAALYSQAGTGKNVIDFTLLGDTFEVLNSNSTVLSLAGGLTASSVTTTNGVMTALVSSETVANLPTLVLYPKTGGAPTQVTLGTTTYSKGAVATTELSNGNVAVFWTSSGQVYGSVVTPSGSVVVTPIFVGVCATGAPISVVELENGNLVYGTINTSNQAEFLIANAELTTIVKTSTVLDGCTGETQVSLTALRDGFGFLVEDGLTVSGYYLGPTGSLIGQLPNDLGVSGGNIKLSLVSPLAGPVGSSQILISAANSATTNIGLSLLQIDTAPQVSVPISSPQTFQVGEQVALEASFTDLDTNWGDTLTYGYSTTPANGPNLSYNGTHLVGTIDPSNRGNNFTSALTATDTAGLSANTTFSVSVPDSPLVVTPVTSPVNVTLGYPFSWFVPNGTISSIFNDTLNFTWESILPSGLAFDAQKVEVSGTATSNNILGSIKQVLQAVNPFGTAAQTNITFNVESQPPEAKAPLPNNIFATVGSYVLNVANLVTDVFSLTFGLEGAPSSLSIDPNTGLISGETTSNQVGNYTFNVTICDLFKCLVWQPEFSLTSPTTPTGGPNGTATPPPATPTAPLVTNPVVGYSVTTGQSFYLELPSDLSSGPTVLKGTPSVDWLTFGQTSSGIYFIKSNGNVPYTAYDNTPITIAIHVASNDDPSGPATTYDLALGVQGLAAWQLAVTIVTTVGGAILSVAGFFGVKQWLEKRAKNAAKALGKSDLGGRMKSLSRKNSKTSNMEDGTLSDIPLTSPPPKPKSDFE